MGSKTVTDEDMEHKDKKDGQSLCPDYVKEIGDRERARKAKAAAEATPEPSGQQEATQEVSAEDLIADGEKKAVEAVEEKMAEPTQSEYAEFKRIREKNKTASLAEAAAKPTEPDPSWM